MVDRLASPPARFILPLDDHRLNFIGTDIWRGLQERDEIPFKRRFERVALIYVHLRIESR